MTKKQYNKLNRRETRKCRKIVIDKYLICKEKIVAYIVHNEKE